MDLSTWMMSFVGPSSPPQLIGFKITQVCPQPALFKDPHWDIEMRTW